MPQRLAGQLVDGGDPVADEPVFVVDTAPADESNWSIVATDRSAGDGSWSVTVPNADPKRYHAVAQFEESGTLKNALSKPFLTSQPFVQTGLVTVGFDVLTPSTIGSAIPDSIEEHAIHWYDAKEITASDGDAITTWADIEGDQDLSGSEPTYRESAIDGNPALEFDTDELVANSISVNQPYTIISVFELFDSADSRHVWRSTNRLDSSVQGESHTDDEVWRIRDNDLWGFVEFSDVSKTDGRIEVSVYDAGDSVTRINQIEDSGTGAGDDIDDESFAVGFRKGEDDRYWEGYIGEMIILDTDLTISEMVDVEDYLIDKWDLSI